MGCSGGLWAGLEEGCEGVEEGGGGGAGRGEEDEEGLLRWGEFDHFGVFGWCCGDGGLRVSADVKMVVKGSGPRLVWWAKKFHARLR